MSFVRFSKSRVKPFDPLEQLVRLIATEQNTHQIISTVAADARLLGECRQAFLGGSDPHGHYWQRVLSLCKQHHVLPEHFTKSIALIAYTLNLVRREQDYYDVLEVPRTASREEIKRAFRNLSLTWHPDKNPNDSEASDRFRLIYRAYEILSDETLRRHYDLRMIRPLWVDENAHKEEKYGPIPRKNNYHHFLQLALVVVVLLVLSFFMDTESWWTPGYEPVLQNRSKEEVAALSSSGDTAKSEEEEPGSVLSTPLVDGTAKPSSRETPGQVASDWVQKTEEVSHEKPTGPAPELQIPAGLSSADRTQASEDRAQLQPAKPVSTETPSKPVSISLEPPEPSKPEVSLNREDVSHGVRNTDGSIYAVQAGDTLLGIAGKHGITVDTLCRLNAINERTTLRIGQELKVVPVEVALASYAEKTTEFPRNEPEMPEAIQESEFKDKPVERAKKAEGEPPAMETKTPGKVQKQGVTVNLVEVVEKTEPNLLAVEPEASQVVQKPEPGDKPVDVANKVETEQPAAGAKVPEVVQKPEPVDRAIQVAATTSPTQMTGKTTQGKPAESVPRPQPPVDLNPDQGIPASENKRQPEPAKPVSVKAIPKPASVLLENKDSLRSEGSSSDKGDIGPMAKMANISTYTIQHGDTLLGIAGKHSITVDTLCRLNGIDEKTILQIGQELKVVPVEAVLASHVEARPTEFAGKERETPGKPASEDKPVETAKRTVTEHPVTRPKTAEIVQMPVVTTVKPAQVTEKTIQDLPAAESKISETIQKPDSENKSVDVAKKTVTGRSASVPKAPEIVLKADPRDKPSEVVRKVVMERPSVGPRGPEIILKPEPVATRPVEVVKKAAASVPSVDSRANRPQTEEKASEDVHGRIKNFLNLYTGTYERKDLNGFLKLFEPGATENGDRLTNLIPVYKDNFKQAQRLRYHIELKKWSVTNDGVNVSGMFRLKAHLQGESPVESYGSIQIGLARHGEDFRVRRLEYRFSGSRQTQ